MAKVILRNNWISPKGRVRKGLGRYEPVDVDNDLLQHLPTTAMIQGEDKKYRVKDEHFEWGGRALGDYRQPRGKESDFVTQMTRDRKDEAGVVIVRGPQDELYEADTARATAESEDDVLSEEYEPEQPGDKLAEFQAKLDAESKPKKKRGRPRQSR